MTDEEALATLKAAVDAVASAAEYMAADPIHGGDQWREFADRLRAIVRAELPVTSTAPRGAA